MLKLRVFKLGNSLLLGLICLLSGGVFFLSSGAHGDSFGADCPPNWSNIGDGSCYEEKTLLDTHQTSCATSPSGLCCTYEGYKVVCSEDGYYLGDAYFLNKAGAAGFCPNPSVSSQCIYSEPPTGVGGIDA